MKKPTMAESSDTNTCTMELQPTNADILRTINAMKDEITNSVKSVLEDSLSESINYAMNKASDASAAVECVKKENKELKSEISDLWKAVHDLKAENVSLKQKVINIEQHSKKANLLFDGFPEVKGETEESCRSKVRKVLEEIGMENFETVEIPRCHRLGKYSVRRTRPIVAFFQSYNDRKEVWSKRFTLKDSDEKWFVKEHFPAEIEKVRRRLKPIVQAAKKIDHYKERVYLSGDKLVVNGIAYTEDNIHNLPPDINPKTLAERSDCDTLCFYSKHSPLSNFYPCSVKYEGLMYTGSEQAVSHMKCLLFNDYDAARKVMSFKDPAEQKTAANDSKIEGFDPRVWEAKRDELMEGILRAKFIQNDFLKDYLIKTGEKTLGEASFYDKYWGTGASLNNKDVLNRRAWTGVNKLGLILQSIRRDLKSQDDMSDQSGQSTESHSANHTVT
jgi:ribA/ribD-fused uncharacterized protein